MITREDILAMTEEDFKHWWNTDEKKSLNDLSVFPSPVEYMRFWFELHRKFGKIILASM